MNWNIRKTSFNIYIGKKKFFPFCLVCFVIFILSKWHNFESLFSLTLCLTLLPLYLCLNHLSVRVVFISVYILTYCVIMKLLFFQLLSQLPQTFQFINIAQLQFLYFIFFWDTQINWYMEWRGNVCNYYVCIWYIYSNN